MFRMFLEFYLKNIFPTSTRYCSVTKSRPTLCDSMHCSRDRLLCLLLSPGACSNSSHWVGDAIQPSHPLTSPSPTAFNLSQHQGLFKWISSSHQVAEVLEFRFSISPWMNIQDWFPLGWTGWISLQSKGLGESSPTPWFKSINSVLSFRHSPTLTSIYDYWEVHVLAKTLLLSNWEDVPWGRMCGS